MVAGRARWMADMRLAKAHGLIDKITKGRPPKPKPWWVERREARQILEQKIKELGPPVGRVPFDQQSDAEQLRTLARVSLKKLYEILKFRLGKNNLKLMAIQRETAADVIRTQVRVDQGALRAQGVDRIATVLEEVARLKRLHVEAEKASKEGPAIERQPPGL